MADFIFWLVVSIVDSVLFRGPGASRRAYEAYRDAYRSEGRLPTEANLPSLREQFKQHSCEGAYVDPDGVPLASWISSWRAGSSPRAARKQARRFRPTARD